MGWSFACDPSFGKFELVKKLKNEGSRRYWSEGVEVIATSVMGNNVWQVLKSPDGTLGIMLTLIQSGGRDEGWGSKSMDESAGPCECNCPLSYLAMVTDPGGYATEWREKVRRYHAQRKAKGALSVGDPVSIYGKPYRLTLKLKRGWNVVSLLTNDRYRALKDFVPITEAEAKDLIQTHSQAQKKAA